MAQGADWGIDFRPKRLYYWFWSVPGKGTVEIMNPFIHPIQIGGITLESNQTVRYDGVKSGFYQQFTELMGTRYRVAEILESEHQQLDLHNSIPEPALANHDAKLR